MHSEKRYLFIKRIMDIVGSGIGLILLSPIFLLTAIAIRIDSPGPIFYGQTRVGKGEKTFFMWKFRSMHQDSEELRKKLERVNEMSGGILFKMKEDPRITRVGKFIRAYSIDELPQLWNIFVGDMSIVGPRPCLPHEFDAWPAYARIRLEVKPGLTCYWQIRGRSSLTFEQQMELDTDYIIEMSIWTDIKIIFATIPAVLLKRGAY